jgi:hypothetical protein
LLTSAISSEHCASLVAVDIFFLMVHAIEMTMICYICFLNELQASKPRAVVKLWKAQIEEPKLNLADPSIIIFDKGTSMYHALVFNLQIWQF